MTGRGGERRGFKQQSASVAHLKMALKRGGRGKKGSQSKKENTAHAHREGRRRERGAIFRQKYAKQLSRIQVRVDRGGGDWSKRKIREEPGTWGKRGR